MILNEGGVMELIFDLTNCSESEKSKIIEDYSYEPWQLELKDKIKCNCSNQDFKLKVKDYSNNIDPILNFLSENEKVLLRAECLKCKASSLVFRNFNEGDLSKAGLQIQDLEKKLNNIAK